MQKLIIHWPVFFFSSRGGEEEGCPRHGGQLLQSKKYATDPGPRVNPKRTRLGNLLFEFKYSFDRFRHLTKTQNDRLRNLYFID